MQYLLGVLIGIALLVLVALSARYLPDGVKIAFPAEFLPALIFFAGLGSIVSVVMRLSKLDVVREISRSILLISGLGRPFVASAFALVIYLIISNKLIAIAVGATDAADDGVGTYLVIAFLCGFSERFAQDILDRTERGFGPPVKQNE